MTIHVGSYPRTQETILCDVFVAPRKRYPGYRGKAPVSSPRVYDTVRYMRLYPAGAGDSHRPDRPSPGRHLSSNKRECPVGTPSFRSLCRSAARRRGSRPCPACGRAASHPPLRPVTLPTLCGCGAAARPACLRQSGKCGGRSPPPSRLRRQLLRNVGGGSGLRACGACQPPAVAQATRARRKAKPASGPLRGPCPGHSPRSVAAQVLRRGPAPTMWGLWGRPRLRPGRRRSGQPRQHGHACGAGRAARLCLRTRRPA